MAHSSQLGAPEDPAANVFIMNALFATLTNVNFDEEAFRTEYIPKAIELREKARQRYVKTAMVIAIALL